jgi:tyrosyl-tRNA synthetase
MEEGLKDGSVHPRNAKVHTAQELVKLYHSQEEAEGALAEFERMFVNKELPDEIEENILTFDNPIQQIADVLFVAGLAPSKKEAKRLIQRVAFMLTESARTIQCRLSISLNSDC